MLAPVVPRELKKRIISMKDGTFAIPRKQVALLPLTEVASEGVSVVNNKKMALRIMVKGALMPNPQESWVDFRVKLSLANARELTARIMIVKDGTLTILREQATFIIPVKRTSVVNHKGTILKILAKRTVLTTLGKETLTLSLQGLGTHGLTLSHALELTAQVISLVKGMLTASPKEGTLTIPRQRAA